MKKKIGIVSLGCPKNLVDSEIMLGLLSEKENYEITNDEKDASIIIVNTCGFVDSAKQESIETILEMSEYKNEKCELLIVTGCLAERYREDIVEEIPEVDAVVGTGCYGDIADIIERASKGEKPVVFKKPEDIEYLENTRLISTKSGYAYLKIAEGCDNCCTYCIIPSLRGRYRSRKMEDIFSEAKRLAESGVKELILVAQDTTRYGTDLYEKKMLPRLINKLSEIEGIKWIRLLYCYPEMIDDDLIEEMANNNKVCKYLDIPIQHSSDKILKSMNRRGTSEEIKNLIVKLRKRIPDIIIRTSVIVGFPAEDEDDFRNLFEFIGKYKFDRLGVFTYSREENTAAAKMKQQVKAKEKQERYDSIMKLQREIAGELNGNRVNKEYETIVEGVSEDGIFYYGRTYAEAPDIDGMIYFTAREPLNIGDFVKVKIINSDYYDLTGDVVDESGE